MTQITNRHSNDRPAGTPKDFPKTFTAAVNRLERAMNDENVIFVEPFGLESTFCLWTTNLLVPPPRLGKRRGVFCGKAFRAALICHFGGMSTLVWVPNLDRYGLLIENKQPHSQRLILYPERTTWEEIEGNPKYYLSPLWNDTPFRRVEEEYQLFEIFDFISSTLTVANLCMNATALIDNGSKDMPNIGFLKYSDISRMTLNFLRCKDIIEQDFELERIQYEVATELAQEAQDSGRPRDEVYKILSEALGRHVKSNEHARQGKEASKKKKKRRDFDHMFFLDSLGYKTRRILSRRELLSRDPIDGLIDKYDEICWRLPLSVELKDFYHFMTRLYLLKASVELDSNPSDFEECSGLKWFDRAQKLWIFNRQQTHKPDPGFFGAVVATCWLYTKNRLRVKAVSAMETWATPRLSSPFRRPDIISKISNRIIRKL